MGRAYRVGSYNFGAPWAGGGRMERRVGRKRTCDAD